MWNYLFYLAYISEKTITEHSGEESYVFREFNRSSLNWIPYKRCKQIDLFSENDIMMTMKEMDRIENSVSYQREISKREDFYSAQMKF